jgi:hypothetical protein
MSRGAVILIAGLAVTAVGFAKTIPPVIEVGVALVIIGMITKPKSEP